MANNEQLEILRSGLSQWEQWRAKNPHVKIDLREADLKGFDLHGVNLEEARLGAADLRGVDLTRANLRGASLRWANLMDADLSYADLGASYLIMAQLTGAHLRQTDISNVILTGAKLERSELYGTKVTTADLSGVDLSYAKIVDVDFASVNFTKVKLNSTIFQNVDFSQSLKLDQVEHQGPSVLDTYTIQRSKGKIPLAFLRGCGFRDLDIEYARLAEPGLDPEQVTDIAYKLHQLYLGGGIQYYSCFISYNSKDEGFARRLHNDLQENGVRCWFAPEDMKIGDQIRPRIDQEIRLRDKLLVILSENSVQSEWVGDEVEAALEEEGKADRLVLFPIRLDDAVMNTRDDWAAKIKRRRHIGDFSNWKEKDFYQRSLERLLRDLKAS